jgi:putative ABC transport system substrate-binding protein
MIQRRQFISLLGGVAAAWPGVARGQQPKPLTVGFLGAGEALQQRQWTDAFVQRLRELGWIEGRTITIAYRWADGSTERAAEFTSELVRLGVNVIVTSGTQIVLAAMQATDSTPIIFATAADPLGGGLVASLSRPGRNATGLSLQSTDLSGKRLELLREVIPSFQRLAIMANVGNPAAMLEMNEVRIAGDGLGLKVTTHEIRRREDFASVFQALKGRVQALYVVPDPLANLNRVRINTLALTAHLPTMHGFREYVEVGGLMSYGASFTDLWRRAGDYIDKILRGAKPAELPVEQPTKFDLTINLITAQALGLTIPPMLLARADEVIE